MVSWRELQARMQEFFRFSRQEKIGLLAAIIITGFIFSFRDWGAEQLDVLVGVRNLLLVTLVAGISFLFRTACQKTYGLSEGYKTEFKVWWAGMLIALALAFISQGRFTVVLAGTMMSVFMVKQRLGEFRYGFSYWHNGLIAYWGVLGNLIMALLFAVGWYFFPTSYLFSKGVTLNLIMAFTSLIPIPQLDGLAIFFGSRGLYVFGVALSALAAVLLFTRTKIGLIASIVLGVVYGAIYLLIGSEK